MKKIRKPLKKSILRGCVLLIALLCLALGLLNWRSYSRMQYRSCEDLLTKVLGYAAAGIDTVDLAECVQSGQVSPACRALQSVLDDFRDGMGLQALYIVAPLGDAVTDGLRQVLAAGNPADDAIEAEPDRLGGDALAPETARKYREALASGQLSFFESAGAQGDSYTGLLPLRDGAGEVFAALCADLDTREIQGSIRAHSLGNLGVTLALGALGALLFLLWAGRDITRPIEQLESAASDLAEASKRHDDPETLVLHAPELHSGNELEALSESVRLISGEMRESIRKMLRTQTELARLNTLAHKDGLTRVGNKVAYNNYAKDLQHKMDTQSPEYAIIMADCNHLKRINDTYGHEKGDSYLKDSCSLLCNIFHRSPVFRVGGDEFVIVLTGHDFENRQELLGRTADAMRQTQEKPNAQPWEQISIAIGVALYRPGEDKTVEDVYVRADQAMYAEKVRMNAVRV